MKKKSFAQAIIILLLNMITLHAIAQQQKLSVQPNPVQVETPNDSKDIHYSYKLYNASNNAFGYDLFRNGRPIFHQFILTFITDGGKRSFATKPQAEKAAALAIVKIEKHRPPAITEEEIKKIADSN